MLYLNVFQADDLFKGVGSEARLYLKTVVYAKPDFAILIVYPNDKNKRRQVRKELLLTNLEL